jgi:hypothetical protein
MSKTSQIFKNEIPNELFFSFLEKICAKNEKYYVFNNDSYKKGIYNNEIPSFLEVCKPYYYISKRKYLERKMNYTYFVTILRQICKANNINYASQLKYTNSSYCIHYYFYY